MGKVLFSTFTMYQIKTKRITHKQETLVLDYVPR